MRLETMKDILIKARKGKYGVGAFEFWSLDSAQAVVEGANEVGVPAILQVGDIETAFAGGVHNIVRLANMAAEGSKVPIALHLDHAVEYKFICEALDAGFTSVMIDASKLALKENMKITQKVVKQAQKYGATVEAELGKVGGAESSIVVDEAEATQTDPDEAVKFVNETGIDALAVAIGTIHGFYRSEPKINIERLKKIASKVSIPLVLHGGSGTPHDKVQETIQHGIAKINICTEFQAAYGKNYTYTQQQEGFRFSAPTFFAPGKQAGKELVISKMKLFAGK